MSVQVKCPKYQLLYTRLMESIPTKYLFFIYAMVALPFITTILGVIALIVAAILYFTNRRKAALKILKVVGVVVLVLIAFSWFTKNSLGI